MKTNTASWFKIILFIFISMSFTSCHYIENCKNRVEDKNEAEKITNQFYELVKQDNFSKTYNLFSNKFFSVTDTVKLNNIFRTTNEKLGAIDSIKLYNWETAIIKGTVEKSNYFLQYKVKRKKFNSKETFILTKEKGIVKIIGFNVSSDGLFAPEKKQ